MPATIIKLIIFDESLREQIIFLPLKQKNHSVSHPQKDPRHPFDQAHPAA